MEARARAESIVGRERKMWVMISVGRVSKYIMAGVGGFFDGMCLWRSGTWCIFFLDLPPLLQIFFFKSSCLTGLDIKARQHY